MGNKEAGQDTLKKDLLGAVAVGVLAPIFASISAVNTGLPVATWIIFVVFFTMCVLGIFVGRFLGRYVPFLYKFVKFGEVGGLNWLIDLGVLNGLIYLTGIAGGLYFTLFKGISFLFSASNSYIWNKFWVFDKNKTKDTGKEVGKFFVSTTTGLLFNIAIASAALYLGTQLLNLNDTGVANVAAIVGSLSAMVLNFALYKFWVFK